MTTSDSCDPVLVLSPSAIPPLLVRGESRWEEGQEFGVDVYLSPALRIGSAKKAPAHDSQVALPQSLLVETAQPSTDSIQVSNSTDRAPLLGETAQTPAASQAKGSHSPAPSPGAPLSQPAHKDRLSALAPALKDRSNHGMSPTIEVRKRPLARQLSTSLASSCRPPQLDTFSFVDAIAAEGPIKTVESPAKRFKGHTSKHFQLTKKYRPVRVLASSNGAQLVRSSAQFIGNTIQSAFTLSPQCDNNNKQSQDVDKSPYHSELPSIDQVAEIRRLIHEYTLLDPLDRQGSDQSQQIHAMTGYTLNSPFGSSTTVMGNYKPVATRSDKLKILMDLNIDLAKLDACKICDQKLAEICTQCRYERSGCMFRFVHMPSGREITAQQYEERYSVMLQQLCQMRSAHWSEYFAILFDAKNSDLNHHDSKLSVFSPVSSEASSTRVLINGDDSDSPDIRPSTGVLIGGDDGAAADPLGRLSFANDESSSFENSTFSFNHSQDLKTTSFHGAFSLPTDTDMSLAASLAASLVQIMQQQQQQQHKDIPSDLQDQDM